MGIFRPISCLHHLTTIFTTSPTHHLTISPPHHLTTSPSQYLTTSPSHHLTISPSPHLTASPATRHLTISPSPHLTISPPRVMRRTGDDAPHIYIRNYVDRLTPYFDWQN